MNQLSPRPLAMNFAWVWYYIISQGHMNFAMTSSYFKTVLEGKHFYALIKLPIYNEVYKVIIPVSIGNVLLEKSIRVFSKPSRFKYD